MAKNGILATVPVRLFQKGRYKDRENENRETPLLALFNVGLFMGINGRHEEGAEVGLVGEWETIAHKRVYPNNLGTKKESS